MEERLRAWQLATEIVDKIVEKNPLVTYRNGAVFGNNGLTYTASEQYLNHVQAVADWLLENTRGE